MVAFDFAIIPTTKFNICSDQLLGWGSPLLIAKSLKDSFIMIFRLGPR